MTEPARPRPTPSDTLSSIGRTADRLGVAAYLVGGAVRDRLRRRRVRDLDVTIEGDAVEFARAWAPEIGGSVVSSSEFGTAAVELPPGARVPRVDFASARAEVYPSPAALPRTRAAGIAEDLARRDFTINAMAIPLNGPAKGTVLDPHGGRKDLSRGIVRMLHSRSPQDDPTRAFRAVRFSMRFGFRIDPATRRWISGAIASRAFERLSGDRLRREILLLFGEQRPSAAVRAMAALGLVKVTSESLKAGPATACRLDFLEALARRLRRQAECPALLSWSLDIPDGARAPAARRLGLAGAAALEFEKVRSRVDPARSLSGKGRLSELAAHCRRWPADSLLAVASALSPAGAARLLRAWSLASNVRLKISGEDLRRSGAQPGPAIGRALDRTWRARIDRRIAAADELPFALAELRK